MAPWGEKHKQKKITRGDRRQIWHSTKPTRLGLNAKQVKGNSSKKRPICVKKGERNRLRNARPAQLLVSGGVVITTEPRKNANKRGGNVVRKKRVFGPSRGPYRKKKRNSSPPCVQKERKRCCYREGERKNYSYNGTEIAGKADPKNVATGSRSNAAPPSPQKEGGSGKKVLHLKTLLSA